MPNWRKLFFGVTADAARSLMRHDCDIGVEERTFQLRWSSAVPPDLGCLTRAHLSRVHFAGGLSGLLRFRYLFSSTSG